MILVSWGDSCTSCVTLAKKFPSFKKVIISSKEDSPELLQVKKALFKLKHNGHFPCLLNDDMSQLIQKENIIKFIETYERTRK